MNTPSLELIETTGAIDETLPVAALYEELAAMINRYHRARPQVPVSEIADALHELASVVREKAATEGGAAGWQSPQQPLVNSAQEISALDLFNIFAEIKGEWLYSPLPQQSISQGTNKKAGK